MSEIEFFDCRAMIGRRTAIDEKEPYKTEDLLADMEYFRIKDCLVHHANSKEYDPNAGNDCLLREIKGRPSLHGSFALLPAATREQGTAEEAVAAMLKSGCRAAWMWPSTQVFPMNEMTCGSILAELEKRRIPLFLDTTEVSLGGAAAICGAHPELPVISTNVGYRSLRELYAIWEKHKNHHVDTSMQTTHCGLEDACPRFGAERFLFGSNWPHFTPGSAIAHITYARISDKDKAKIAGGNLRRMLAEVRP
ncbi:MAG: amidohydrolase family protein [Planctomycetota bacterium]